jgi:hypothetical protein
MHNKLALVTVYFFVVRTLCVSVLLSVLFFLLQPLWGLKYIIIVRSLQMRFRVSSVVSSVRLFLIKRAVTLVTFFMVTFVGKPGSYHKKS